MSGLSTDQSCRSMLESTRAWFYLNWSTTGKRFGLFMLRTYGHYVNIIVMRKVCGFGHVPIPARTRRWWDDYELWAVYASVETLEKAGNTSSQLYHASKVDINKWHKRSHFQYGLKEAHVIEYLYCVVYEGHTQMLKHTISWLHKERRVHWARSLRDNMRPVFFNAAFWPSPRDETDGPAQTIYVLCAVTVHAQYSIWPLHHSRSWKVFTLPT